MADDALYLELEELKAQQEELSGIVRQLIEREQSLGELALPDDLDENAREAKELEQDERISALEVGEPPDLTPEVLTELEGTAVNPYVLTPTPEGTETADTLVWDIAAPPEVSPATDPVTYYDGVTVKLHTRSVYNDAGDSVLYGFYRLFTFNSAGLLKTISAETKYTIDTPGACP